MELHYLPTQQDNNGRAHEDVSTLPREMVMYGFMQRERGVYRVAEQTPARGKNVAQETGGVGHGLLARYRVV